MLARVRHWFGRLFGREAQQQKREIFELAHQANVYPDNVRLILRLGDCYLKSGDRERAISAYWHVVDLYKKRQDWLKAAAVLKRIVAFAPSEMIARFELAQCFEKLTRRREAAQQWEQAARLLESRNDVAGALRCYSRANLLDPVANQLADQIARLRPEPKLISVPKLAPLPQLAPTPQQSASSLEPTPVKPNLASLGRAQLKDEPFPAPATLLDDPLDGFDLGVDGKTTTEYSAAEFGTLLDGNFEAETMALESLPIFDEEHRPTDTPADLIFLSP